MDKLSLLGFKAKVAMQRKMDSAIEKVAKKMSGDSQIVVALVLIAVAVGLCIIFRNQIKEIMANLTNKISNAITTLSDGIVQ